jgi:hypothetical protein
VDIIAENVQLPELQIGDLIVSGSMGAYTTASATEFNSLPRTKVLVLHGAAPSGRSAGTDSRRPTPPSHQRFEAVRGS